MSTPDPRFRLHHEVHGEGPPAIIQSPAWGPSSDYLRLTLAPLLDGFEVVTFDPRNVGRSAPVEDPAAQAIDHLVDDLEDLRAALEIDRFLLLGHSHGGRVAMAYAGRHGERLSGLVLLNTSLREPGVGPEVEALLDELESDPMRRRAVRRFRETRGRPAGVRTDAQLARHMRELMPVYFRDLETMKRFAGAARGARPPSVAAALRVPEGIEPAIEEGLAGLAVPTLVLTGRHDVATPPAESEYIRARIAGAELAIFENSGHHPWFEEPDAFRAVFSKFAAHIGGQE